MHRRLSLSVVVAAASLAVAAPATAAPSAAAPPAAHSAAAPQLSHTQRASGWDDGPGSPGRSSWARHAPRTWTHGWSFGHPSRTPSAGTPTTLATGLVGPLSLAVGLDGVYVADNFAASLLKVRSGKAPTTLYSSPQVEGMSGEVGAVSVGLGRVVFAESYAAAEGGPPADAEDAQDPGTDEGAGDDAPPWSATLQQVDLRGKVSQVADLGAAEIRTNPDGSTTYGFLDASPQCAAQFEAAGLGPLVAPGEVYSHPFASLVLPGRTIVADAGANVLWNVDGRGRVTPLAVLPPQRYALSSATAQTYGVPACAGQTYTAQPVPTDVELGPDGWLYVSLLPGGPEDTGAHGAVYRVSPSTGRAVKVAGGFTAATDLAVSLRGDVYVAELFGDRISVVPRGSSTPQELLGVSQPGAVEWTPLGLYATTDALGALFSPPGTPPSAKVVRIPLR
ncbi:ScyD/ScyE family protein [Cellulomonas sp. PhB143]|uniref:ScyD/ScyE family protein n=1 Tax=Cellulomonas sp. PhB143 TaxID=2485186 RepID=UPI000F480DDE|nr:ScyD/ScyE family protein [Cellulomonas sp. PhB143]ROS79164.1 hypothetical protein EDF32_0046 [Cellulomonas sp. PhB143]